jgi:hypothetical protein
MFANHFTLLDQTRHSYVGWLYDKERLWSGVCFLWEPVWCVRRDIRRLKIAPSRNYTRQKGKDVITRAWFSIQRSFLTKNGAMRYNSTSPFLKAELFMESETNFAFSNVRQNGWLAKEQCLQYLFAKKTEEVPSSERTKNSSERERNARAKNRERMRLTLVGRKKDFDRRKDSLRRSCAW